MPFQSPVSLRISAAFDINMWSYDVRDESHNHFKINETISNNFCLHILPLSLLFVRCVPMSFAFSPLCSPFTALSPLFSSSFAFSPQFLNLCLFSSLHTDTSCSLHGESYLNLPYHFLSQLSNVNIFTIVIDIVAILPTLFQIEYMSF